jgi:ABC-type lipoprotein release transport system permease subunit
MDPAAVACVAGVVIAIAVAASLAPSRRASRSAPMDLLRDA